MVKGRTVQFSSSLSIPVIPLRPSTSRYICLQCRHRVARQYPAPRSNPTTTPSLHRTYATEPGLPDRIQKFVAERIAPKLFKGGEIPKADDKADEDTANTPAKDAEVTKTEDIDYKPATSGEDLEAIGGPSGWWENAWDEEHQFQGFMRPTPMQDPGEIRKAIERALVEWYTVEKGDMAFREAVGAAHRLWANDRSWELVPVGNISLRQTEKGRVKLEWQRREDQMKMHNWLQRSFRDAVRAIDDEADELSESEREELEASTDMSVQDVNYSAVPVGDATNATAAESEDSRISPLDGDGVGPGKSAAKRHPKGRKSTVQYTGLQGNISLHNHNLKFTVMKRVMQLTGIRIPDTAIQSIESSSDLFEHLIQKPKPTKLAQLLVKNIPNVKVLPTKYVPSMAERALGRQKVIDQELDRHGIPVPFREEIEQITAYEEHRLRQQIDAMSEDDAADPQNVWGQEGLQDEGGKVQEVYR
ncbi:MAG: hypothetical protein Q9200_006389 [Gallowayella weberi]